MNLGQGNKMKEKEIFKLGDDLIGVLRELIQLSILTGTNIVDHMRAIRVEVVDSTVVPTEEYIEAYNQQIKDLNQKAEEEHEKMLESLRDGEYN